MLYNKIIKIAINITCFIFLSGCTATLLEYNPKISTDALNNTMSSIKEKILTQPEGRSPLKVNITENFIQLNGNFEGEKSTSDEHAGLIPFKSINKLTLHNKNEWYLVSLVKNDNRLFFRYFSKNADDAKKFMDNIYTMMQHRPDPYKPVIVENQEEIKNTYRFTKEDINYGQTPVKNITPPPTPVQKDVSSAMPVQNLDDISEQFKKLKELKDLGVLTDSEYESKRKILADKL